MDNCWCPVHQSPASPHRTNPSLEMVAHPGVKEARAAPAPETKPETKKSSPASPGGNTPPTGRRNSFPSRYSPSAHRVAKQSFDLAVVPKKRCTSIERRTGTQEHTLHGENDFRDA